MRDDSGSDLVAVISGECEVDKRGGSLYHNAFSFLFFIFCLCLCHNDNKISFEKFLY